MFHTATKSNNVKIMNAMAKKGDEGKERSKSRDHLKKESKDDTVKKSSSSRKQDSESSKHRRSRSETEEQRAERKRREREEGRSRGDKDERLSSHKPDDRKERRKSEHKSSRDTEAKSEHKSSRDPEANNSRASKERREKRSSKDGLESKSREGSSKDDRHKRSKTEDGKSEDGHHRSITGDDKSENRHRRSKTGDQKSEDKHKRLKTEERDGKSAEKKSKSRDDVDKNDALRSSTKEQKERSSKEHRSKERSSEDKEHRSSKDKHHRSGSSKHARESSASKEKLSSEKSSKEKDADVKEKEKVVEEKKNEAEYNYDEDEFDAYGDDDFEDDDQSEEDEENSEEESTKQQSASEPIKPQPTMINLSAAEKNGVNEVFQAINAENEKAVIQRSSPRTVKSDKSDEKLSKKVSEKAAAAGKINFVAASEKQLNQKIASKTKQRGEALLKLVQLDVRSFNLFEMSPMTEYELYMKKFGRNDTKQMFTQTNDDNISQELQTEEIETEAKWCQHSHDMKACGGSNKNGGDKEDINSIITNDSVRLGKFLIKASKVCISLLEELEAGIEQPQRKYTESRTQYSDGYVTLSSSDFLVLGRNFCDASYSPTQTNLLLTAYGPSNVVKSGQKSPKGLLCVWNTNEPNKAQMLLTCESIPNSCCFSTGKASLAFAGMEDGVLGVWDLREADNLHTSALVGGKPQVFRTATFTTAGYQEERHCFPIISIAPLMSHATSKVVSTEKGVEMSFQLASMDQTGTILIWVVVETEENNSTLATDNFGLSPKGRVKLVKSGVIQPPGASLERLFSVTCMQVDPANPNHIYIGTEKGSVNHVSRFERPSPKQLHNVEDTTVRVNAIDISPWRQPYILVCYTNGIIRLFNTKYERSILSWNVLSQEMEVCDVQWSRSRASVFFAMDTTSVLYVWDLLQDDTGPIVQHELKRKDKRAIGFSFTNDYSSLGIGTVGRSAEMAVVYGDGSVEVHRLSKQLSEMSQPDEIDQIEQYLQDIT